MNHKFQIANFKLLLFAFCLLPSAFGTPVMFPLQSFFNGANYTKGVTITAVNPELTDGTNLYAGSYLTLLPTGGINPLVNLAPNNYTLTFADVRTPLHFSVYATNGVVNVLTLVTNGLASYYPILPGSAVALPHAYVYSNNAVYFNGVTTSFPSSTTAGIQEAINLLPHSAVPTIPGGGVVELASAVPYYTTSTILISNTGPFYVEIMGQGNVVNGITYAGSVTQDVVRAAGDANYNVAARLDRLWISSINDMKTNLVECSQLAEFSAVDVFEGHWPFMTNHLGGAGIGFNVGYGGGFYGSPNETAKNLVPMYFDQTYGGLYEVASCNFLGCAALYDGSDVSSVHDNFFLDCGGLNLNDNALINATSPILSHTNSWPATSLFAAGSAIITDVGASGGNRTYERNNFADCYVNYLNNGGNNNSRDDHAAEGNDIDVMFTPTSGIWIQEEPELGRGTYQLTNGPAGYGIDLTTFNDSNLSFDAKLTQINMRYGTINYDSGLTITPQVTSPNFYGTFNGTATAAQLLVGQGYLAKSNRLAWASLDNVPSFDAANAALNATNHLGALAFSNRLTWASIDSAPSFITGNQTITFSGAATGSGSTAVTLTLAAGTTNGFAGTNQNSAMTWTNGNNLLGGNGLWITNHPASGLNTNGSTGQGQVLANIGAGLVGWTNAASAVSVYPQTNIIYWPPISGNNLLTFNNTFFGQYMVAGQSVIWTLSCLPILNTALAGKDQTATNIYVYLPMFTTNTAGGSVNWNESLQVLTNGIGSSLSGTYVLKNANVQMIGAYSPSNTTTFVITNPIPYSMLTNLASDFRVNFYNNGTTNFFLFAPYVVLGK